MLGARGGPPIGDLALTAALVLPLTAAGAPAAVLLAGCALVIASGLTAQRSPSTSLGIVTSLALLAALAGPDALGAWAAPAVVVLAHVAGRRGVATPTARTVFVVIGALSLLVSLALGVGWQWPLVLLLEAGAILGWALGRYVALRDDLTGEGWRRAEVLAGESKEAVAAARERERRRIARDMHDSLGHKLSLLTLQAGALELDRDLDEPTRANVAALRVSATEATDQLHDVVGMLAADEESDGAPVATEAAVRSLVSGARAAGAAVTFRPDGELGQVPDTVGRAIHAVVQESLTNALKHAPGAPIEVSVSSGADRIGVVVTNAATAPPTTGGSGLAGLEERVRNIGGTLRAEYRSGRHRVSATLPRQPRGETPAAAASPAGTRPDRTRLRRRIRRVALIPVAVLVVLAATFLGLRSYTTITIGLGESAFESLEVGQARSDAEASLPPSHMDQTLPVVAEPAVPDGAECEYYYTTTNPFSLSNDLYRLCWADGVLVSKDELHEGDAS